MTSLSSLVGSSSSYSYEKYDNIRMSPSHLLARKCVILIAVTSLEQGCGEGRALIMFQIQIRHLTLPLSAREKIAPHELVKCLY
jgi:hypothetical protein